jgi:Nif-specific regulatory protein
MDLLLSFAWPGNVRELENAVERAVVTSQSDPLTPEAFALAGRAQAREDQYAGKQLKEAVNVFKRYYIRQTLEMNRWNQTKTAKLLGIQRTYLSRLVKELEITHSH